MMRRAVVAVILVTLALWAGSARAQTLRKDAVTIKGIVLGADGKPVPAAAVTCESSAGMKPRAVHTDSKGHYAITGLKQDSYDIRASAKGAYSDWERNIPLKKGQTKEITLRLLNGNTALSGELPSKQKP